MTDEHIAWIIFLFLCYYGIWLLIAGSIKLYGYFSRPWGKNKKK